MEVWTWMTRNIVEARFHHWLVRAPKTWKLENSSFACAVYFALLILSMLASCGGNGSADSVAKISVPNVVGLTQTAATSELAGAGLTVGTITSVSSSTVPSGNVVSQLPAAGALLMTASPVSLTVSSGPAVVTVPSLAGMSLATATSTLTGLGLVLAQSQC